MNKKYPHSTCNTIHKINALHMHYPKYTKHKHYTHTYTNHKIHILLPHIHKPQNTQTSYIARNTRVIHKINGLNTLYTKP